MNGIRSYLISIVAVCMICVISQQMIQKEKLRKVLRFVGGLLILLVVAMPLVSLDGTDLRRVLENTGSYLDVDTDSIEESAQNALRDHIKETTETYIEQKAKSWGASVRAVVTLTEEEYPVPYSVRIIGTLTQSQQMQLGTYMSRDLGIEFTRQEWELYG